MTQNQIAAYVPVIRAIEQASGKELRAIARVEQAVKGAIGQGPAVDAAERPDNTQQPPKSKVFDPKRARRQQAQKNSNSQVETDEPPGSKNELAELTKAVTNIRPAAIKQAVTQAIQAPGDEQQDVVAAIDRQSKDLIRIQEATNSTLDGMYQDEQGRLRQANGAFATRQQKEIVTGKQSGDAEIKQGAFAKILNWAKGRFMDDRQEDAVDAAGVAAGGSFFLAGKEMFQLAKSAKGMADRVRGIDGLSGAGRGGKAPVAAEQQAENPPAADPVQAVQEKTKSNLTLRRQAVDFAFSLFRNPKRAVLSLFQRAARGNFDKQVTDSNAIYSVNQSGAKSPTAMSAASISRADRQSDLMRDAIDDQTTALTLAINETTEAIKDLKLNVDTGSGLMDMVGDFFERGRRKRSGRTGKKPGWRERLGGWGSDKRQPAGSRRAPGRMGSYSGMGAGPIDGRAPAKPTMWEKTKGWFTGKPAGTAAQTGAAAAGNGGKFAGALRMGGTVLSRLALPLTAALAAFEGFKGFTDTEGQKRAFNLRDGEEASLGQKSAMAAGQVISAGGLTEMLFGVSGDDIARTLYEFFGGSPRPHALAAYQPVTAGAFSSAGMAAATKTGATQAQVVSKSPMVMANTTPAKSGGMVRSSTGDTNMETDLPSRAPAAGAPAQKAGSLVYASPAIPPAPPAPAPAPQKADPKPAVVVAQLDQKSLKALADANKTAPAAPVQQSTTNNVENIRMQTKSPGQVPLSASDQLMHLQSLDRM